MNAANVPRRQIRMDEDPSATPGTTGSPSSPRLLKRLFWLYFWLLIFEGSLRKWVVPQLSAPLLIIRDPVVILMYFIAMDKRLFPRSPFIQALLILAVLSSFLALLQLITLGIPFKVLVFGLRADFLHFPLIFLVPKIFNADDLKKFGLWVMILAIPMAMLMAYQFRSAPDARINRVAGLGEGLQLSSALGKIRPSGTFSFITGPVAFFALVTSFLGYAATTGRKFYPKWLVIATCVALGLAVAVSGSRATMLAGGVVMLTWLLGLVAARRMSESITHLMMFGVVTFFVLGQIDLFREGTEVFSARWDLATGAESTTGGLVNRIIDSIKSPLVGMFHVPFLGYGLGVGTNVGAALLSGQAQFLLSEGEWGRVLMEMGPLLGLGFIVYRVCLTVWLGKLSIKSATAGNILPLLIYSACAVGIFNGQIAQPTALGFAVMGGGLCLAAMNIPSPAADPTKSANLLEAQERNRLRRARKRVDRPESRS